MGIFRRKNGIIRGCKPGDKFVDAKGNEFVIIGKKTGDVYEMERCTNLSYTRYFDGQGHPRHMIHPYRRMYDGESAYDIVSKVEKEDVATIRKREFENEIAAIKDKSLRELAEDILTKVPDYFFTAPASSSGKYHPKSELGNGGLMKHSVNVARMVDHITAPNTVWNIDGHRRDCLKVAALFHDCRKFGTDVDYLMNNSTSKVHPLAASNLVMQCCDEMGIGYEDRKLISDCIASHMGEWGGVDILPETDEQKILHLADYLASRKDICIGECDHCCLNLGCTSRIPDNPVG